MSDFNPITLFFILYESMGVWLWLLLTLALVLFVGIVASALNLRRAGRPAKRPILAALIAGSIVTLAATFAVPVWTLADIGALSAAVDYIFAFLFALIPGAVIAALVFMLVARCCADHDLVQSIRNQGQ
ncbi:MAG: DUF5368 family protein [Afipia sp.]|nr:DUF5368 family protein [Afipia sp.]